MARKELLVAGFRGIAKATTLRAIAAQKKLWRLAGNKLPSGGLGDSCVRSRLAGQPPVADALPAPVGTPPMQAQPSQQRQQPPASLLVPSRQACHVPAMDQRLCPPLQLRAWWAPLPLLAPPAWHPSPRLVAFRPRAAPALPHHRCGEHAQPRSRPRLKPRQRRQAACQPQ